MSDLQTGISAAIAVAKVCCQFHCTWQKKRHGQKQLEKPLKRKPNTILHSSHHCEALQIFQLFFSFFSPLRHTGDLFSFTRHMKRGAAVIPWSALCAGQKWEPVFFRGAVAGNSPQRLGNSDGDTCGWPLRSAPARGHRRALPLLCALPICPSEMFRRTDRQWHKRADRSVENESREKGDERQKKKRRKATDRGVKRASVEAD